MNNFRCLSCGEPLPTWARADRRTCSVRCRVAVWRGVGRARRAESEPVGRVAAGAFTAAPGRPQALHPERPKTALRRARRSTQFDNNRHGVAPAGGGNVQH
jgi:hypothetical protein